jgi:hypothetical protein
LIVSPEWNYPILKQEVGKMPNVPKLLIVAGFVLIVIGVIWAIGGKFIHFGRLPGDIVVDKGNFKFYFPVVTCILISVIVSLIFYVIRWFK